MTPRIRPGIAMADTQFDEHQWYENFRFIKDTFQFILNEIEGEMMRPAADITMYRVVSAKRQGLSTRCWATFGNFWYFEQLNSLRVTFLHCEKSWFSTKSEKSEQLFHISQCFSRQFMISCETGAFPLGQIMGARCMQRGC